MHGRRIELGIMKKALLVTIVCFVIPGLFYVNAYRSKAAVAGS